MIKNTKEIIKYFDFLSQQIGFEYMGSTKYQGLIGGLYSLIVIVITIVIGAMFSKDVYFRESPIVLDYKEPVEINPIYLKNFPIIISVADERNSILKNYKDYLNITLVEFFIPEDLKNIKRNIYTNPIVPCNASNYDVSDEIKSLFLPDFSDKGIYCLNDFTGEMHFKNSFASNNSTFINIRIQPNCNSETHKCPEELKSYINYIAISIGYVVGYTNSNNYSNPLKYDFIVHNYQLSYGINKRVIFDIIKNNYISDNGWILNNDYIYSYNSLDTYNFDVSLNNVCLEDDFLFWFTFTSPLLIKKTKRNYLKVQDLIANVGGFYSIISISMSFMSLLHLRFEYLKFLRNIAGQNDSYNLKNKAFKSPELNKNEFNSLKGKNNIFIEKGLINIVDKYKTDEINKNDVSDVKPINLNALNDINIKKTSDNKSSFSFSKHNLIKNNTVLLKNNNYIESNEGNNNYIDTNKDKNINITNIKPDNFCFMKNSDSLYKDNTSNLNNLKLLNIINSVDKNYNSQSLESQNKPKLNLKKYLEKKRPVTYSKLIHNLSIKNNLYIVDNSKFNYIYYIYCLIFCKKKAKNNIDKQIKNIEKLLDICPLLKIMTFQYSD